MKFALPRRRPRAYYNEFDPNAAEWLRNLISAGMIAPGDVDERSITEVQPDDLSGYTQCHFFAGIGGWSLALRLSGWPDDRPVWTGSCPCQPFSCAGKRKGTKDARHLWPWLRHLMFRCRPAIAFGEQVASKDGRLWLAGVRGNLETLGYAVGAADLCAAGVGAPHIRQRLYWLANAKCAERWPLRSDRINGNVRNQIERNKGASRSGLCRETVRLADANDERIRAGGHHENDGSARRMCDPNGQWERVRLDARPQRHAGHGDGGSESGRLDPQPVRPTPAASETCRGSWSNFAIIHCADGKYRRVPAIGMADAERDGGRIDQPGRSTQSEILGLDHGLPAGMGQPCPERFPVRAKTRGRIARLKGYGNAIVPELAAQFILACMDATK